MKHTAHAKKLVAAQLGSGEYTIEDTHTPLVIDMSQAWHEAARIMAEKMLSFGRVGDIDSRSSERLYFLAKELLSVVAALEELEGSGPELQASLQRQSIDKIISISKEANKLMTVEFDIRRWT